MFNALPRAGFCACLSIMALAGTPALAFDNNEIIPTGFLKVCSDVVRTGTRSPLNWNIDLQSIDVAPDGTVTPQRDCRMKIRILGLINQVTSNNGHGNNVDGVDASNPGISFEGEDSDPTVDDEINTTGGGGTCNTYNVWAELHCSSTSTGWTRIFYGDSAGVDPTVPVVETIVKADEPIEFAARAFTTQWLPVISTANATPQLATLRDGDPLPDIPALQIEEPAEYLAPYLTLDKHVRIGRRDLIYILELTQTDSSRPDFDLQDLVILVTFE